MQKFSFMMAARAVVLLSPMAAAAPALPHVEQIGPGVYAAGFAHRYGSANTGWIALSDRTILVDLPRGVPAGPYLEAVRRTGAPERFILALTRWQEGDETLLAACIAAGVERVFCSPAVQAFATAGAKELPAARIVGVTVNTPLGEPQIPVEMIPMDGVASVGGAALYLPGRKVLFAGPLVSNGPRVPLLGAKTGPWVDTLRRLKTLSTEQVVPGFGTWGDGDILQRQLRFLLEVRRQVGHLVAQGCPREQLAKVQVPADTLGWMPYAQPRLEDLEQVYRELRVPVAPYGDARPARNSPRPHALVLIGDGPHEPGRLEDGLRPVFEATGVTPHFTVDVEALNAENLSRVPLLVIFRDGRQRPGTGPGSDYTWMTPEQEQAVVAFVKGGGGFLNLHNAMGLYPGNGPYLDLVGGRYAGHGPLERFRVEVVDPHHPVTRDVTNFTVADEQHTPPFDENRCRLLLRNRSPDGAVIAAAGWVREPGDGRLCYLANGHTREALQHPMFQRLMRNAVNWLLHRE